jgi:hypothetical protein
MNQALYAHVNNKKKKKERKKMSTSFHTLDLQFSSVSVHQHSLEGLLKQIAGHIFHDLVDLGWDLKICFKFPFPSNFWAISGSLP